jgi:hypothetical protein
MLAAKRSFETYASTHGVKIRHYHADSGRSPEKRFLNHCELAGQKVYLCGVSAHFQNGIAERRIKDLTERSRTYLLHAVHRWPSAITINLWPYALRYINNDVYNATPALKSGQTPLERFSATAVRPKVLDFHPPFCPVYVLHNGLQGSGSRPNKWVRRSRCAVYLGKSSIHARPVTLVLSLLTGYVLAQFHLKHDDFFETVKDLNALPQSKWQELARFTPEEIQGKAVKKSPGAESKFQWEPDHTPMDAGFAEEGLPEEGEGSVPQPHLPFDPFDEKGEIHLEESPPGASSHGTSTQSGRQSNPPERFMEMVYAVFDDTDAVEDYEMQKEAEAPIAFAASRGDPDTLSYKDMMGAIDSPEFKTAMVKEANDHANRGTWGIWEKRNVPEGHKILSSAWAFKRKWGIDTRKAYKRKPCLNIHSAQQTNGVNYWESFSPGVNWFSIRLCMTFALLIFDWYTRQIDFVLAFPQADVECDLFMGLPRGLVFEGVDRSTQCVKLIKNIYMVKSKQGVSGMTITLLKDSKNHPACLRQ